jgi:hypothetical protein
MGLRAVAVSVMATAVALLPSARVANAAANASIWVVQPGARMPQWFGHAFLCFDDVGPEAQNADCYNFGALSSPPATFLKDFLRGRSEYRTQVLPAVRVAALYRSEARPILRVPIRVSAEEATRLRSIADSLYGPGKAYTYRPFRDNCSTRIVQVLYRGLGSNWPHSIGLRELPRLHLRDSLEVDLENGPTRRAALVLLTDSLLGAIDTIGEVDGHFLPFQFMAQQASGFHVPKLWLWRVVLIVFLALAGSIPGRRGGRPWLAALLGGFAVVSWGARCCGGMPEMAANLAWLLYCPLDSCLFWDKGWIRKYMAVRIVLTVSLAVASLLGVIDQPLGWPVTAVVVGLVAGMRRRSTGVRMRGPNSVQSTFLLNRTSDSCVDPSEHALNSS